MGRPEVLKVVGGHLIDRPGVIDRFLREIRSAARLRHANIVTAYAARRIGESLVFAMEYVKGLDLARMVKVNGPLPVAHACNYVYQAALGLQHAHEHGMVHRDIKPANLILSHEGKKAVIKVLDFGLAKVTSEGNSDSGLTREGQMLGTPDFIAPEQIRDAQSADIRADIYSLGCTLYYLLTGRPPFAGDNIWDLYQAHFSMNAGALNLVRPEVPGELAALVAKMMAKDPAMRFQTPGEVAGALKPYFQPGSVAPLASKPDISRTGAPEAKPAPSRAVPIAVLPPKEMASAPAPVARMPSDAARPDSILEGLIDLGETDPLFDSLLDRAPPAAAPKRIQQGKIARTTALETIRNLDPRTWWATAGLLLLVLVVVGTVAVFRVQTRYGVIVLEIDQADAEVSVDGEKITVKVPGDSKPVDIPAAPGRHKLRVSKEGFKAFADDIEFTVGNPAHVAVKLVETRVSRPREMPKLAPTNMQPVNGLLTEFFEGREFEHKLKARVDTNIDWLWGWDAPDPEVPKDHFSARWTGWLKAPRPGRYKIIAVADDGVRLWLDGKLLIDEWHGGHPTRYILEVDLTGKPQALKLDYFQHSWSAVMSLRWEQSGRFQERSISGDALFLDELTAQRTAVILPDESPSGKTNGLKAEFFEGIGFGRKLKTRVDSQIDWLWGYDAPDPDVPKDNFSARWTGWLKAPQPGLYRLIVVCDDGARLWLDGKPVIDAWRHQLPGRYTATVDLTGKAQPLKLEYFNGKSSAIICLRWQKVGGFREEPIPATAFSQERDEASFTITTTSESTSRLANRSSTQSPPAKPPAPPAVDGVKTNARSLPGTGQATRLRDRGTAKADLNVPFRVATNGLAGAQFIDPITFGPDPLGFNERGTAVPWAAPDAFAQLRTKAVLGYPQLPVSRYVFEVELTVHKGGHILFLLGDQRHASALDLSWNPKREIIECFLREMNYFGWGWNGSHDFAPERRLSLKVVVGDGMQALFHENKRIVPHTAGFIFPTDCCLRIWSETLDSATIHRCLFRPLTEQDIAACGWTTPPTEVPFKDGEAAARLAKICERHPAQPKPRANFAVKTTGTPMAWIPPGEFMMGPGNPKDPGYERRHRVRLTYGYWMAQTEVTQGEYRRVSGANPSRVRGSPYLPVDWVARDQAAEYCLRLTNLEYKARLKLPRGYVYRLPTEAEWEYACRAGSDEDFSVPDKSVCWREACGYRPHEVAESPPNKWGLYDMHGNAMEWCFDAWYEYPKGDKGVTIDPFKIGRPDKDAFVIRGGAWWGPRHFCTSHWRYLNHNSPNGFRGFRIVLGPEIREPESGN
jgi:formylglycine-generating enzyme required for sulfatase activity